MMVERYFGLVYVFSMIFLSDLRLSKEQSSRKYRGNPLTATIHVFDQRLMILYGIRIYTNLSMFYCRGIHNILSLLRDLNYFRWKIFYLLWDKLRDVKPPWPNIVDRIYQNFTIFIIFISVTLIIFNLFQGEI